VIYPQYDPCVLKTDIKIKIYGAESYGASIPWCAPEQLLGDPCTPATDIFALGVIIWELCTGEPASSMRNYRAVETPREAPEPIAQLIKTCMIYEPEGRPTASEVHNIIISCGICGSKK